MKSYKVILNKTGKQKGGVADLIVVDGVVGIGKTSLMEILENEGYVAFEEPVIDNPILDKFYDNRARFAFPLQIFFLNKRFEHIKNASKLENTVLDRSIYGDAIFAKMLNKADEMTNEEYQIYVELLENMLEHVQKPKLIIYLEADTETAIKRIKTRGRSYEQDVERDYWVNLNEEYKEYFGTYDLSPVLKLNADTLDFVNKPEDREFVLSEIRKKLSEIKG